METQIYSLINYYELDVDFDTILVDIDEQIKKSPDYLLYVIKLLVWIDTLLRFIFVKSKLIDNSQYLTFIIYKRIPVLYNLYKLIGSLLLLRIK
jgi:hypothetical protein